MSKTMNNCGAKNLGRERPRQGASRSRNLDECACHSSGGRSPQIEAPLCSHDDPPRVQGAQPGSSPYHAPSLSHATVVTLPHPRLPTAPDPPPQDLTALGQGFLPHILGARGRCLVLACLMLQHRLSPGSSLEGGSLCPHGRPRSLKNSF